MSPIDRGASIPRDLATGREPIHPEHAYIDPDGYRSIDMEVAVSPGEDGAILISDLEREPIAAVIELSAEGLEFLVEEMEAHHPGDRFTRQLAYARRLARVVAWDRAAGIQR